ncbi:type II secretion system F family protein [Thermogladius sp. 4427co]|uniref:type II secretion system F family protein n=1 Tax=Thermogladius sp. 4427co TaxID=3450718 RepID=UPI003F7A6760
MGFYDKVYKWFEPLGLRILDLYPFLNDSIRKSNLFIHPPVYASIIAFAVVSSIGLSTGLLIVSIIMRNVLLAVISIIIPAISLLILIAYPSIRASNISSAINTEFPYTMSYLSVLVQSGISPYVAFERVAKSGRILPHSAALSERFSLLVRVLGKDPLTAFGMLGERSPSPIVRDVLSGYVTTVRAGGDVVDYLNKTARTLFNDMLVRIKITADRLGGLLESYLAVVLLTMLTMTVMYFVTQSFAGVVPFGLSGGSMFLLLYILMPLLSFAVIYFADLLQFKEPWMDWRPYIIAAGVTLPVTALLLFFGWVLYTSIPPYHSLKYNPVLSGMYWILVWPATTFKLPSYTYSSIALGMALVYSTIPAVLYYEKVSREYRIVNGITRFIRDLVEVRKTGLSPERSILELSRRKYGVFTDYLRKMALELELGIPLSKIIDEFMKKIKVWRAKILLYMLTDSIEVGGATIEVLEALAGFAESVEAIEVEKKRSLRTLMIVPYMGAILTAMTVILMVAYMGQLPVSVGAFEAAANQVLPSIVLNTYIMGLVAGKVANESTASGFKHALVLTITTIATFLLVPVIGGGLMSAAGA